jgi:hypothetical protein
MNYKEYLKLHKKKTGKEFEEDDNILFRADPFELSGFCILNEILPEDQFKKFVIYLLTNWELERKTPVELSLDNFNKRYGASKPHEVIIFYLDIVIETNDQLSHAQALIEVDNYIKKLERRILSIETELNEVSINQSSIDKVTLTNIRELLNKYNARGKYDINNDKNTIQYIHELLEGAGY